MNMLWLDMSSPGVAADFRADMESAAGLHWLAAAHPEELGIRLVADAPLAVRTHPPMAADAAGAGMVTAAVDRDGIDPSP